MRTVALFGFAEPTRGGIATSQADAMWSVVWAYKYKEIPRIDRLFEMHPIWLQAASEKEEYQKVRDHYQWLKENQTIPIYMMENRYEIPRCVRYPIEQVWYLLPLERQHSHFGSSVDYMMALAIYEGYQTIELYGIEMGSETEYRYQRESFQYWVGQCDARGIKIVFPQNTILFKKKMYGYEGGSMIYRQSMEAVLLQRRNQMITDTAAYNGLKGQAFRRLVEYGDKDPEYIKMDEELDSRAKLLFILDGAIQQLQLLLKEIDLEEPDQTLTNHFQDHLVRAMPSESPSQEISNGIPAQRDVQPMR